MKLTILLLGVLLVTGVLYLHNVLKSDKPSTKKQEIRLRSVPYINDTAVAATNLVATANTVEDSQIAKEDNCYWSEWNYDCSESGYRSRYSTCQSGIGSVQLRPCGDNSATA